MSWSLLVEAATEDEASAIARRVAGRQSELRREFALQEVEHQVRRPLGLRLDEEPVNGRSSSGTAEREAAETGAARD